MRVCAFLQVVKMGKAKNRIFGPLLTRNGSLLMGNGPLLYHFLRLFCVKIGKDARKVRTL